MITLDLSGRSLHMAETEGRGDGVKLSRASTVELPEGAVKNGLIVDENAFVSAVGAEMKRAGFKSRNLAVSVGTGVTAIKTMSLPAVGQKQMRSVIKSEIERLGAGDQRNRAADSLFDYIILGADPDDPKKLKILTVMLPGALVESWFSVTEALGKKPGSLECWFSSALRAAMLDPELASCPAGIIASLDSEAVNLLLFEHGEYGLYRNVPVANAAPAAQNEFILASFEDKAAPSEEEQVYAAAYDGISKLMQFQSIRNRQNPIQRICLCGEHSGSAELAGRISEAFSVPATAALCPNGVKLPQGADYAEYFAAVGAAIRK